MRCPYCRTSLEENSAECPSCKLTLNRANTLLGAVPRLAQGLEETEMLLSSREIKRLDARIKEMKRRFPQVTLHIIVQELPAKHPFDLYLFWMFNNACLSEEAHKGGENRDILLLIDPSQNRVGLIVGYGLEPFLREEALDHLLELSEPAFKEKRWIDGFLGIVEGIDQLLESAAVDIQEALGIQTLLRKSRSEGEY